MELDVPFRPQTEEYNCGPANVAMVAEYHGADCSVERANQLVGFEGKGVTSAELALALTELGLHTEFLSAGHDFNPAHYEEEFYQEHGPGEEENRRLYSEMEQKGVEIVDASLPLEELLELLDAGPLIVLLDWNTVTGGEGYHGHFITVTGFDTSHVFVHDADDPGGDSRSIERELFDRARKAHGTSEDIIRARPQPT